MALAKWVEWRNFLVNFYYIAHDEMKPSQDELTLNEMSMTLANKKLFMNSTKQRQSINSKAEGELNWVKTFIELCPVVATGDCSSR